MGGGTVNCKRPIPTDIHKALHTIRNIELLVHILFGIGVNLHVIGIQCHAEVYVRAILHHPLHMIGHGLTL
jgi:hypothetical protein